MTALGSIGHLEAGKAMEEVIDKSFEPLTSWGRKQIVNWVNKTRNNMVKKPQYHNGEETNKFIKKIIPKYDLDQLYQIYNEIKIIE